MFGCTWKIEFSRFAFQLTVKRSLWPGNCFTFLFSLQPFPNRASDAQREREKETVSKNRLNSSPTTTDWAPVRRPTLRRSQHRANQAKIDSNATRSHLRRAISPLDRTQSPLSLPSSLNLTRFDEFFFFGFVDWEMILYICLEAEKIWATSRKCVFYGIFKNITKH